MVKRRTTVLGLGALAMGSGAAFTSAAFQNSVDADADMRVVVDQQLIARAGEKFDGLSVGDATTENGTFIAKVSAEPNTPTPTDILFEDETINGYTSVTDDSSSDRIPTPAAVVNDGENGDFAFAIATDINDDVTYDDLIEVENQSEETADVGITFAGFGADASDVGGGGEEAVATEIYRFEADDDGTTQISTDDSGWISSADQEPADRLDVSTGDTEQIDLINNTGGGSGVSPGDIRQAFVPDGTPTFSETFGDADLVDTIEIGVGEDSES